MIAAYQDPHPRAGKLLLFTLAKRFRRGFPGGLEELASLERTLLNRRGDILAYFNLGASNGPVEAINVL
ncbi:transposase [Corynebacterium bovis]|uniref:transposase n=1 Tax=Corynebacterium bovis TaxID=36808 RepID=UPI0035D7A154